MGLLDFNAGTGLWIVAIIALLITAWFGAFNNLIFAGMLVLFAKWSFDNATRTSAAGGDRSLSFVMLGLGAVSFAIAMNQIQPGFFGDLGLPFSVAGDATAASGGVDWSNLFGTVGYEDSVLAKLDPSVLMALGFGVIYALSKNQKKFAQWLRRVF